MILEFKFYSELSIKLFPDRIRFTSSLNYQTSTITLTFYNPSLLLNSLSNLRDLLAIKSLCIQENNKEYSTKDIRIIWVKGRPLFLQAVFLILSPEDSMILKASFQPYLTQNNLI